MSLSNFFRFWLFLLPARKSYQKLKIYTLMRPGVAVGELPLMMESILESGKLIYPAILALCILKSCMRIMGKLYGEVEMEELVDSNLIR